MTALAPSARPCPTAILACIFLLLPSCGPSTSPLTLELRTADTHVPIPGAGVEIDSLALGPSLQVPDVVDDLMGRRVAFMDRGLTDAAGRAIIQHIPDRALRLTFLAPGAPPAFSLVNHDVTDTPSAWRRASGDATGRSMLEFRMATGEAITSPQPSSSPASH